MSLSSIAPYLIALALAYPIFYLYCARQHRLRLSSNGCQPPYHHPSGSLPLGLSLILPLMRAFKTHSHLEMLAARFAACGHKTYSFTALGMTSIATMEADNFREILSTGFPNFGFGEMRKGNFASSFGTQGIFTVDGEEWTHARGVLRPQFKIGREEMLRMFAMSFEPAFQRLMRKVDLAGGQVIDLQPLFFRLTLETSLRFLYGVELEGAGSDEVLNVTEEDLRQFEWAFNGIQMHLAKRHRLQRFYWLGGGKEFKDMIKVMHDFAERIITRCTSLLPSSASPVASSDSKSGKYIFLHSLLPSTPSEHLRDHTLSILLAARDSTAITLSFLCTHLSYNPSIFTTLRSQILSLYGPTLETLLAKLEEKGPDYIEAHPPLLANAISETLRLHPPVPLNQRYAFRDSTLPRGGGPDGTAPIFVAKGQRVDLNFFALHHDKDIWGDDVEQWRPERWEEMERGERRKVSVWEFAPFSGGKRICLGKGFATKEIAFLMVRFLQEIEKLEGEKGQEGMERYKREGIKGGSYLAMYVAEGARVRCWRKDESSA